MRFNSILILIFFIVVPVSISIFTPVPLAIILIYKKIKQRWEYHKHNLQLMLLWFTKVWRLQFSKLIIFPGIPKRGTLLATQLKKIKMNLLLKYSLVVNKNIYFLFIYLFYFHYGILLLKLKCNSFVSPGPRSSTHQLQSCQRLAAVNCTLMNIMLCKNIAE